MTVSTALASLCNVVIESAKQLKRATKAGSMERVIASDLCCTATITLRIALSQEAIRGATTR
jgi:hypothetical protein